MVTSPISNSLKNFALATAITLAALPLAAQAEDAPAASEGVFGLPISLLNFEVNGAYLIQGEGTNTTGGSVGTFDFGWRPEYRLSESLSIPLRVMFTTLKEAGGEGTEDDVTYLSGSVTVGADYAITPAIIAGVDVGLQDFDGGNKLLAGVRGQYKFGFADDSILKLIDAVQASYHYLSTDGSLHELRAGVVIRF